MSLEEVPHEGAVKVANDALCWVLLVVLVIICVCNAAHDSVLAVRSKRAAERSLSSPPADSTSSCVSSVRMSMFCSLVGALPPHVRHAVQSEYFETSCLESFDAADADSEGFLAAKKLLTALTSVVDGYMPSDVSADIYAQQADIWGVSGKVERARFVNFATSVLVQSHLISQISDLHSRNPSRRPTVSNILVNTPVVEDDISEAASVETFSGMPFVVANFSGRPPSSRQSSRRPSVSDIELDLEAPVDEDDTGEATGVETSPGMTSPRQSSSRQPFSDIVLDLEAPVGDDDNGEAGGVETFCGRPSVVGKDVGGPSLGRLPKFLLAAVEDGNLAQSCSSLFALLDSGRLGYLVPDQLHRLFVALADLSGHDKAMVKQHCCKLCCLIGGPSMHISESQFVMFVLATAAFSNLEITLAGFSEEDLLDEEIARSVTMTLEQMLGDSLPLPAPQTAAVARERSEKVRSTAPVSGSAVLQYLDNAKLFLTVVVVQHHVFCCFADVQTGGGWYIQFGGYANWFGTFAAYVSSINQSYFMSLFFFISAYFTPGSFDRKGQLAFLKDKVKRLGYPILCWYFVAGPLLIWTVDMLIPTGSTARPYKPVTGPPWFILWLLIFNFAYALIPMPVYRASFRWPIAFALTASVGALQGILQMFVPPGREFIYINVGYMPMYVLFFGAGIVARRSLWLLELEIMQLQRLVCLGLVSFILMVSLFFTAKEHMYRSDNVVQSIIINAVLGLLCSILNSMVLMICHRYFNHGKPSDRLRELYRASYSVYLLHAWLVVLFAVSFAWILDARGIPIAFEKVESGWRSSTPLSSELYLLLGCTYTGVLTQLVVWPIASAFRRLPLVKEIV